MPSVRVVGVGMNGIKNLFELPVGELPNLPVVDWGDLATLGEVVAPAPPVGYGLGYIDMAGRALLSARSCGVDIVYRLKDTRPMLTGEIAFWGGLLAKLTEGRTFDAVTHAPSSGKRPAGEHLATLLAHGCAAALSLPCASLFVNEAPRGHRASIHEKLREVGGYRYTGEAGRRLVVVDDVVYTGSTARRCMAAVGGAVELFFAVLYRTGG